MDINSLEKHKNNPVNHKKILRIMRLLGIRPQYKGVSRYNSYKGQIGKIASNLLLEKRINDKGKLYEYRNFEANKPYKKLATDVTEFKVGEYKVYLSPVIDMFNSEIIAYSYSTQPNLPLVKNMFKQLIDILPKESHPILHSDQGWQYQHKGIQKLLLNNEIIQSMSRKGNCLDNSIIENFFGRMKCEMYYGYTYESVEELMESIDNYIYYYNNKRIKLKLKGLSPVQYRIQYSNQSFY